MKDAEYQVIAFASPSEWEEWLRSENGKTPGIWMKYAKKGSGITTLNHQEAIEVALCYGWIDGQGKKLDDNYWLVKFTPRGAKSIWSKRNVEIVDRLISEKRMQAAGLIQIEAAKKDGRWDLAYDSPKNMVVPADFLKMLAKDKKAESFFQTLNKTNTYAIVWRLQTAKKPETRVRRMTAILEMLSKEEKFH